MELHPVAETAGLNPILFRLALPIVAFLAGQKQVEALWLLISQIRKNCLKGADSWRLGIFTLPLFLFSLFETLNWCLELQWPFLTLKWILGIWVLNCSPRDQKERRMLGAWYMRSHQAYPGQCYMEVCYMEVCKNVVALTTLALFVEYQIKNRNKY